MLQNTLYNVKENLLKKCILNEKQVDLLIKNMKFWKVGKTIYPSQLKSLLYVDFKKVYEILEFIKKLGILEYNYEIYCSKCDKFIDSPPLKSLNQFPKDLYCDDNHKLSPLTDTILIYKVICNE